MGLPESIGRYQIVGHLATGGMAEILLGKLLGPSGFERAVVIKRTLPHLAREQQFEQMFLDEARIVARIRHPNVVQVHELGREADELFLVMEYLDGETAWGLMRRLRSMGETLPWGLSAHIVAETCAGLHAAHELSSDDGDPENLVHRDVSPQNVMVLYDGQVKVLDFGIAKASDSNARTEAGQIKGKFSYMSPEQCRAEPLDRRSDVFSLGIVLFELTTGRRLFARDNELMTLKAICDEPMVRPSVVVPGYPSRLEEVVMRALSRLREDRYQSALEMRRDLLAAMRDIVADPVPEDVLARLMKRAFADRIKDKNEMLRQIKAGSTIFQVPAAEADPSVDIPVVVEQGMPPPVESRSSIKPGVLQTGRTPSARGWLLMGLAALVAIGIGVTAFALGSSPTADTAEASPALDQDSVRSETPSEEPPAATTLPEPAPFVTLHVDSAPEGAEVLVEGAVVANTPADLQLRRGTDELQIELRHDGYRTLVERVRPDVDQRLRLTLLRARSSSRTKMRTTMTSRTETDMAASGFRRYD